MKKTNKGGTRMALYYTTLYWVLGRWSWSKHLKDNKRTWVSYVPDISHSKCKDAKMDTGWHTVRREKNVSSQPESSRRGRQGSASIWTSRLRNEFHFTPRVLENYYEEVSPIGYCFFFFFKKGTNRKIFFLLPCVSEEKEC